MSNSETAAKRPKKPAANTQAKLRSGGEEGPGNRRSPFLSRSDLADRWLLSLASIDLKIAAGEIPVVRPPGSRRVLISRSWVEAQDGEAS